MTLLRRPAGRVTLAALAERVEPGLGERLTGAVGLLEDGHRARLARPDRGGGGGGGAAGGRGRPRRTVPSRRAWRREAVGAVAAACVALALVRPEPFGRLARRFLAPWADVERVGRYAVAVDPGDAVAAVGDEPAVRAEVRPRFGGAADPGPVVLDRADRGKRAGGRRWSRRDGGFRGRSRAGPIPRDGGRRREPLVSDQGGGAPASPGSPRGSSRRPTPRRRPSTPRTPRVEAWEGSRVDLTVTASRAVRSVGVDWPGVTERTQSDATLAPTASPRRPPSRRTPRASSRSRCGTGTGSRAARAAVQLQLRTDQPPTVGLPGRGARRGEGGRHLASRRHGEGRRRGRLGQVALQGRAGRVVGRRDGRTAHRGGDAGLDTPSARGTVRLPLAPLGLRPGERRRLPGPRGRPTAPRREGRTSSGRTGSGWG